MKIRKIFSDLENNNLVTILKRISSGTFLVCEQRALADEWENITGAVDTSRASDMTLIKNLKAIISGS